MGFKQEFDDGYLEIIDFLSGPNGLGYRHFKRHYDNSFTGTYKYSELGVKLGRMAGTATAVLSLGLVPVVLDLYQQLKKSESTD